MDASIDEPSGVDDGAEVQAHGSVNSTSPYRAFQEALNSALDDANNNKIFVQSVPCDASFED